MENPIVLFDGDCAFCDASVRFIISRDPKGIFKFAPLRSSAGKELAEKYGFDPEKTDSTVLLENGKAYTHSTAVLKIAKRLKGLQWKIFYALILVPKPLRDFVYKIIARNRHKFFKNDTCLAPTNAEFRKRFLS
ncbi:MAG: DUF393 domain-containing protein [Acidobacteria bacterium]|jgi:predicted DCC family thiol-disulfide oxidoreductase YuxK|nr:MAG: DUF393 domain-containing protein [Acidobacteriota bacterium]GIU82530.1 MAG: hypothetical protein KatS3mg006_1594 [Pyrinomonadaceae bacterium]